MEAKEQLALHQLIQEAIESFSDEKAYFSIAIDEVSLASRIAFHIQRLLDFEWRNMYVIKYYQYKRTYEIGDDWFCDLETKFRFNPSNCENCKVTNYCPVRKNLSRLKSDGNLKSLDLSIHDRKGLHYLSVEIKTKNFFDENQNDINRLTYLTCNNCHCKSACFIEFHITPKGKKAYCKLFYIEKGYVIKVFRADLKNKKDEILCWEDVTQKPYNVWLFKQNHYEIRMFEK